MRVYVCILMWSEKYIHPYTTLHWENNKYKDINNIDIFVSFDLIILSFEVKNLNIIQCRVSVGLM